MILTDMTHAPAARPKSIGHGQVHLDATDPPDDFSNELSSLLEDDAQAALAEKSEDAEDALNLEDNDGNDNQDAALSSDGSFEDHVLISPGAQSPVTRAEAFPKAGMTSALAGDRRPADSADFEVGLKDKSSSTVASTDRATPSARHAEDLVAALAKDGQGQFSTNAGSSLTGQRNTALDAASMTEKAIASRPNHMGGSASLGLSEARLEPHTTGWPTSMKVGSTGLAVSQTVTMALSQKPSHAQMTVMAAVDEEGSGRDLINGVMNARTQATHTSSAASILSTGMIPATPYAGAPFGPLLSGTLEDLADQGANGDLFMDDFGLTTGQTSASNGVTLAQMPIPRVAPHLIAQQIAASVAQPAATSTQIVLNPEELGSVRISLTTGDAGLVVNIVAERPETTDLLRRNIDSLMQEFASLGYDNPSFSFEGRDGGDPHLAEQSSTDRLLPDAEMAEVPTLLNQSRTASGALDLKL